MGRLYQAIQSSCGCHDRTVWWVTENYKVNFRLARRLARRMDGHWPTKSFMLVSVCGSAVAEYQWVDARTPLISFLAWAQCE